VLNSLADYRILAGMLRSNAGVARAERYLHTHHITVYIILLAFDVEHLDWH
jgi:hypothetical protein